MPEKGYQFKQYETKGSEQKETPQTKWDNLVNQAHQEVEIWRGLVMEDPADDVAMAKYQRMSQIESSLRQSQKEGKDLDAVLSDIVKACKKGKFEKGSKELEYAKQTFEFILFSSGLDKEKFDFDTLMKSESSEPLGNGKPKQETQKSDGEQEQQEKAVKVKIGDKEYMVAREEADALNKLMASGVRLSSICVNESLSGCIDAIDIKDIPGTGWPENIDLLLKNFKLPLSLSCYKPGGLIKLPELLNVRQLFCRGNKLKELKLGRGVRAVDCAANELTELRLNEELEWLDCCHNPIEKLKLPKGLRGLGYSLGNPKDISLPEGLEFLYCDSLDYEGKIKLPKLPKTLKVIIIDKERIDERSLKIIQELFEEKGRNYSYDNIFMKKNEKAIYETEGFKTFRTFMGDLTEIEPEQKVGADIDPELRKDLDSLTRDLLRKLDEIKKDYPGAGANFEKLMLNLLKLTDSCPPDKGKK